jgi:hypothetical protein
VISVLKGHRFWTFQLILQLYSQTMADSGAGVDEKDGEMPCRRMILASGLTRIDDEYTVDCLTDKYSAEVLAKYNSNSEEDTTNTKNEDAVNNSFSSSSSLSSVFASGMVLKSDLLLFGCVCAYLYSVRTV